MSLSKIMRHFEGLGRVPVELPEVIAQFQGSGLLETIVIRGLDKPADTLRGVHYRYSEPPMAGSALMDKRYVIIPYSTQQSLQWQRLVICKELVHLYDPPPVTTKARDEILQLGKKLAAPKVQLSATGNGIQHFFDMLAKWRAMAIMFPYGLHEEMMPRYLAGKVTAQQIADMVHLPVEYVEPILTDGWKELRESILD